MFTFIRNLVAANKKTLKNNVGASMIEYALIVAAVVGIAGFWFATGSGDQTDATGITGAIATKLSDVAGDI